MKNAVIYVFSGTGNTLKIVQAYADEFFPAGSELQNSHSRKGRFKALSAARKFRLDGHRLPRPRFQRALRPAPLCGRAALSAFQGIFHTQVVGRAFGNKQCIVG